MLPTAYLCVVYRSQNIAIIFLYGIDRLIL